MLETSDVVTEVWRAEQTKFLNSTDKKGLFNFKKLINNLFKFQVGSWSTNIPSV